MIKELTQQAVLCLTGVALIASFGLATVSNAQSPFASDPPLPGYNKWGARLVPERSVRDVNAGVLPLIHQPNGAIHVGDRVFNSWSEYVMSDLVQNGRKCSSDEVVEGPLPAGAGPDGGSLNDCSSVSTNPAAIYDPAGNIKYRIPVVVHVIRDNSGTQGNLSPALVQTQIDVFNEDYLALVGTPGSPGFNSEIRFYLATVDPFGNPTTGIDYQNNSTWFNDSSAGASYHNSLAWDPQNYLNLYSLNLGAGLLGFATIPQGGGSGTVFDAAHIHWLAFGRPALGGPPYNTGRTATHEVGHYLGLYHTFQSGCGTTSSPGCYSTADRICDTNATAGQNFGCPIGLNTCGDGTDNVQNYMDYTDDTCMNNFTLEQARRMRCTLEHWRPLLWEIYNPAPTNDNCAAAPVAPSGSTPFSTLNATTDGPNECNVGGFTQISNDIWYRYLAPCVGTVTISLCGSSYNAKLAVYAGVCPTLANTAIACADNVCGSSPQVTFNNPAATLYRVRVGGFNGATGTGTMVITCTPAPLCPEDVNNSGAVDIDDLLAVINAWGPRAGCPEDVNDSGFVDIDDLLAVINGWGPC